MGELGGVTRYLYWSSRRTERFLNDNNIPIPQLTTAISSPAISWLPTFSRAVVDLGNRRPLIAKKIETALGQVAVNRFDGPSEITYAKGISPVVFGEFRSWNNLEDQVRQPALMFTAVDYDRKYPQSVAVCLFGSMDNFPEYVQSAGSGYDGGPLREGWVSSSAPAVYDFIKSRGKQFDGMYYTAELMAEQALTIATQQGMLGSGGDDFRMGFHRAWERSYTYGEALNSQWLAQIYLDVDIYDSFAREGIGFRRILVGAPLWIRTPSPQAITLYANTDIAELRARAKPLAKRRRVRAHQSQAPVVAPDATTRNQSGGGVEIPSSIYRTLRAGFVSSTARSIVSYMSGNPPEINDLGSAFGRIFVWVWRNDKDDAMLLLSDLLGAIQDAQEAAGQDRLARLDDILRALPICLPEDFDDYRDLVSMARKEVQAYFGEDPNP